MSQECGPGRQLLILHMVVLLPLLPSLAQQAQMGGRYFNVLLFLVRTDSEERALRPCSYTLCPSLAFVCFEVCSVKSYSIPFYWVPFAPPTPCAQISALSVLSVSLWSLR